MHSYQLTLILRHSIIRAVHILLIVSGKLFGDTITFVNLKGAVFNTTVISPSLFWHAQYMAGAKKLLFCCYTVGVVILGKGCREMSVR